MKDKVEALLFSAGRKMEVEELSRLCNASVGDVAKALKELKKDYENRNSPLMVVQEGSSWKLTVKEMYLPLVQKIITQTELSKSIMETLAVIAWKYPVLQSEVIKIRTNKAYEHLKELEEMGYIAREKSGRTKRIKLTQRFFDYFDLPRDKLKEKFKGFDEIAKAIEIKEAEIEAGKPSESGITDKKEHKPKIEIVDETNIMPTKEELENFKVMPYEEKLGKLEVVGEEPEEEIAEPEEQGEIKKIGVSKTIKKPGKKEIGITLTPEQEKLVDEKVEEILHPPKEETEEKPEKEEEEPIGEEEELNTKKGKEEETEPVDLLEASSKSKKK